MTEEVKVLVVRNASLTAEEFEAMEVRVDGVTLEDTVFVHLVVADSDTPDVVHEKLVEMCDESISAVFVVEDDGAVSDWFEDTTVGDWFDLDLPVLTSEGYSVGYVNDAPND